MPRFSDTASPPIQPEEAERAEHSICFNHGAEKLDGWHSDGRVFYCPLGRQYWRVSREINGFNSRLPYQHTGLI